MTSPPVLAVQVGNTRVQLGLLLAGTAEQTFRFANTDIAAIVAEAVRLWDEIKDEPQAVVMLASVNEKAAVLIESSLADQLGVEIYRIGDDVPVPIGEALDPETIVGVDRLLKFGDLRVGISLALRDPRVANRLDAPGFGQLAP